MLGKLKKKAVPRAEICHPSALSFCIKPSLRRECEQEMKSVLSPFTEKQAWSSERRKAKFSEQPITTSNRTTIASCLCLFWTRQGHKARMLPGSDGMVHAEPRQSVIPGAPARGQPGSKLLRKPAGLIRITPSSNHCSSHKNKTENFEIKCLLTYQ